MPKLVNLEFPMMGLDESGAFRNQRPYSAPDILNCQPLDTISSRARGGSRRGLTRAFLELGAATGLNDAPVKLLNQLSYVGTEKRAEWSDNFDGTALGSLWATASGFSAAPAVLAAGAVATLGAGTAAGVVRSAFTNTTDFDATQIYTIELFCEPYKGAFGGTFRIFARMDNTTPVLATDGISVNLTVSSTGTYFGEIVSYLATAATTTAFSSSGTLDSPGCPFVFKVEIGNGGADVVKAYVDNKLMLSTTVDTHSQTTKKRFGFGLTGVNPTGAVLVDAFRIQYFEAGTRERLRTILIAGAGGALHREIRQGELTELSLTRTIASDRVVRSTEHLQKLYIADTSVVVTGTDGTTDAAGTSFDSATYTSWTAELANGVTLNAEDFALYIVSGTGATAGLYAISSIAAGAITLATSAGANASAISFRIERCPKIFDPKGNSGVGTLTRWVATSGKGSVPQGCDLICTYRDRVVLAGDPTAPNTVYKSRQGDPLDWDYFAAATDVQRAVISSGTLAGYIGEPVTALMPHNDGTLVYGCVNSIYVEEGDISDGGRIRKISGDVGVIRHAWCYGPTGEILFLSKTGLCVMAAGGSPPQMLSRERLPDELLEVDPRIFNVSLVYDLEGRGIHLYLTGNEAKKNRHWWFDWTTKGFFPWTLADAHEPWTVLRYTTFSPGQSAVILGCRDGYIRKYHRAADTDDGTAFSSYALIGPFKPGGSEYRDGTLNELLGVVGNESGEVDWSILSADTAEDAPAATAWTAATGTWVAGRNYSVHPRVRGCNLVLKLANGENRRWAMESVQAVLAEGGKMRKL